MDPLSAIVADIAYLNRRRRETARKLLREATHRLDTACAWGTTDPFATSCAEFAEKILDPSFGKLDSPKENDYA